MLVYPYGKARSVPAFHGNAPQVSAPSTPREAGNDVIETVHSRLKRPVCYLASNVILQARFWQFLQNVHTGLPLRTVQARHFAVLRTASHRSIASPRVLARAVSKQQPGLTVVLTSQNPCFFAGLISRGSGSGKREARGLVETRRRFRLNVRPRGGAVARNRNPASARLRAPVPPVGVAAPASSSFLLNLIHIYTLHTSYYKRAIKSFCDMPVLAQGQASKGLGPRCLLVSRATREIAAVGLD